MKGQIDEINAQMDADMKAKIAEAEAELEKAQEQLFDADRKKEEMAVLMIEKQ